MKAASLQNSARQRQAIDLGLGRLESLPKWLNLVPIVAQWIWLSIRYASVTLPSCANPSIISGGMVGEGKMEYFSSMGELALGVTAKTTSVLLDANRSTDSVRAEMRRTALGFPIILKPDRGWCGFGVRLVRNDSELESYLSEFPAGERLVVQEFLPWAGEAGIFYMREPSEKRGAVIGMLLRHYPRVCGDGRSTIAQLIARDPRLKRVGRGGLGTYCDQTLVPAKGEVVRLSIVSSTRVGGLYLDATEWVTDELRSAIDAIACDMTEFHAGRFDVKFDDWEELRHGRGFKIIEVNGAGSEAVHAWDPSHSLSQAYRIIFAKQRRLFALSAAMRRCGHRPIGLFKLARLHFQQQALIKRYPLSN